MSRISLGQWLLIWGAVFGCLAVAIGAFAAHGLKAVLNQQALGWVETGAKYQMYHAFCLIINAILWRLFPNYSAWIKFSSYSFILGILLFSGSLYWMAYAQNTQFAWLTPIGGLGLIAGWIGLIVFGFQSTQLKIERDLHDQTR